MLRHKENCKKKKKHGRPRPEELQESLKSWFEGKERREFQSTEGGTTPAGVRRSRITRSVIRRKQNTNFRKSHQHHPCQPATRSLRKIDNRKRIAVKGQVLSTGREHRIKKNRWQGATLGEKLKKEDNSSGSSSCPFFLAEEKARMLSPKGGERKTEV